MDQSMEEARTHLLAEDGPVHAALEWLARLMTDGDLRAVWARVDANYRLWLAQSCLWANRAAPEIAVLDRDATAIALAVEEPTHELWDAFAEVQLEPLRVRWPWIDLEARESRAAPVPLRLATSSSS